MCVNYLSQLSFDFFQWVALLLPTIFYCTWWCHIIVFGRSMSNFGSRSFPTWFWISSLADKARLAKNLSWWLSFCFFELSSSWIDLCLRKSNLAHTFFSMTLARDQPKRRMRYWSYVLPSNRGLINSSNKRKLIISLKLFSQLNSYVL